jgi:hypothetical protein
MQKIELNTNYGWATARFGRYSNGHLGIQLFLDGGEPLAKISTNLVDTDLEPREFHFDANNNSDFQEYILRSGHFEDTGKKDQSGWCEYPVFKVKDHIEIVEG